jgi:hypothetical protein
MSDRISGDTRKIVLRGGGTLSVRLDNVTSWMLFGEDERTLMSRIMEAIQEYERSATPETADAVREDVEATTV